MILRREINAVIRIESYIAHPYWPERQLLIDIQKKSNMNLARSEKKRDDALRAEIEKRGLTPTAYRDLEKKAARQWYRVDNDDAGSPIIVPRHHVSAAMVQAIGSTPKALHGPYEKDTFRHEVRISDFVTDKTQADGVFDRYVKLEKSNMRSHQVNEFIQDATARGTLSIDGEVKTDALRRLVTYAIGTVGVGASRKMGYGRGEIVEWVE